MISPKSQEIIDCNLREHINMLADFIRSGEEPNASLAADQLILIGTKAAIDMLAELFVELGDETLALMVLSSSFRKDHREILEQYLDPETLAAAYKDIEEIGEVDIRLTSIQQLLQAIAGALEKVHGTCGDKCTCTRA